VTPLPAALEGEASALVAWRLDERRHAALWNSGEGARRAGGRWNSRGRRAVYCAIDPSTAILEVAAYKGLRALDVVPHTLTSLAIRDADRLRVLQPHEIPEATWLEPGQVSAAQQAFGDRLLSEHGCLVLPSVVSRNSWNVVFDPAALSDQCALVARQDFVLDPRLHAHR